MTVISAMPDDTVQACRDRSLNGDMIEAYISAAYYVNGMGRPHYPVPSTVVIELAWDIRPYNHD